MSTVQISIWSIIAALVLFVAVGGVLFVRALRQEPGKADESPVAMGTRYQRYIGPIDRNRALLGPVRRVALEAFSAGCGFPGMGWMASGRVGIGLPLLCVVPSVVYGFYPVALALSGQLIVSPTIALWPLPFVSVTSSVALAVAEVRERKTAQA